MCFHTPAPCYLHNSDDILHIAGAPSLIYLIPRLGYLRILHVLIIYFIVLQIMRFKAICILLFNEPIRH